MISEGTQSYIYMYPFSPKHPSHPDWHKTLREFPVLYTRSLLGIHFKYSSVYMTFPKSLTIPSPQQPCLVLCASLNGSGFWGRMETCICTAESLHCSPETVTLLTGYTPIRNAFGIKKNQN